MCTNWKYQIRPFTHVDVYAADDFWKSCVNGEIAIMYLGLKLVDLYVIKEGICLVYWYPKMVVMAALLGAQVCGVNISTD